MPLNMSFSRSASKSLAQSSGTTVIAIDKDKNSQQAVKWAVENLFNNSHSRCILLHVRCQSFQPNDSIGIGKDGCPPTDEELQKFFLPYRGFCARKGIEADEVVLHDIEVPSALVDYIINQAINNIVVGASSRNAITRKLKNILDVPTHLMKSAPEFCTVYVISKGKIQQIKQATRPHFPTSHAVAVKQSSLKDYLTDLPNDPSSSEDIIRRIDSSYGNCGNESSDTRPSDKSIKFIRTTSYRKFSKTNPPAISLDSQASDCLPNQISQSVVSNFSGPFSYHSSDFSCENMELSLISEGSRNFLSPQVPHSLETEMRKLKFELEMYNSAYKEAIRAKDRERELHRYMASEAQMIEKSRQAEEAALALAKREKQKTKAAIEATQMAQQLAEMETQKRERAEMSTKRIAEERKRAMNSFVQNNGFYRKYTIEEIEIATNHFSRSHKIGEGGYGPVYRGLLDHTPVAIKVLRPDLSQGLEQFQREVEILSSMRHPHMVILVGACPEYGCLVYEYMENGSLEDRLFQKHNTPPIPWRTRFNIAAEIATGLLFLHLTKPEPLVHRDLKPANILLDRHCVSKISDVGLARLVPPSVAETVTQYCMTAAAGTFCYIDPEYQQTGTLGVKSDIYSLGVVLLQIITARPPMGLSHHVEASMEKGTFREILDPTVTDWPVEETLSFAKLAVKCCEMRRRDRPDLASELLPELNRLRNFALANETSSGNTICAPSRYYG